VAAGVYNRPIVSISIDERLTPDLSRGRDKLISGDLYVDDESSE
jgi:hypothetical protein